ncbi:hypothetical protein W03_21850 [Nitrosomonas sp. PY1]|uniref:hypothetical protein n=1 Tax=Nitrosomonas sp. PY1 TaxID=1803906 RepID=UPI001FC7E0EA|nr:hypothetical protein [Nitrosomonas sp. PY1]GKS70181.1 hypothetical protein W03_21850 [Nitrosomonas sp. PY1]
MEWMQIVSALALIVFFVVLLPGAIDRVKNSPKGTSSDWMNFIFIMLVIIVFIMMLIKLV